MSRVVFAWELGGGYGHIAGFVPIAQQLQQRGHEVIFVVKDLAHAPTLLGENGFWYFQAPVHWPAAVPLAPALSYADVLLNSGFAEKPGLLARTQAWRTLFECLASDLIMVDHAPTALLAVRGVQVPRALFGTGFCSPPRVSPMPSIRPWSPVTDEQLAQSEARAVKAVNSVLDQMGGGPLEKLGDLFEVEEDFLCTFPELDQYQGRLNARYWGPRFDYEGGIAPVWPSGGDRRVFAYVNRAYRAFEPLMQQLCDAPWSVLAHIPGASAAISRKYDRSNVTVWPKPINLPQAGAQCDVAICHAGMGTVTAMLLAGKPLLLLPMHTEQVLTARNVASLGAGLYEYPDAPKPDYSAMITEMLAKGSYQQAASDFAQKYASFVPREHYAQIADRCEHLLREAPRRGSPAQPLIRARREQES